jgi:hypothetical protein
MNKTTLLLIALGIVVGYAVGDKIPLINKLPKL